MELEKDMANGILWKEVFLKVSITEVRGMDLAH